jgi:hypothetical protein
MSYNSGNGWPGSFLPDLPTQAMPEIAFDGQVQEAGLRLGWMKAHFCPCAYGAGFPGSPDPKCVTCQGRGVYWDLAQEFLGYFTYMHTTSAPDEPGALTSELTGHTLYAEPTLTIPKNGFLNESLVWHEAADFDAYVEFDALTRYNTTLVIGQNQVLPYQWGLQVTDATFYNPALHEVFSIAATGISVASGVVTISPASAYPQGTAVTVEYFALPVYVAYRKAGGVAHTRPFAAGRTGIPRRFHLMELDVWLRARGGGESPAAGPHARPLR